MKQTSRRPGKTVGRRDNVRADNHDAENLTPDRKVTKKRYRGMVQSEFYH